MKKILSALLCAVLLCGMILPGAAAQLKSGKTMVDLTGSVKASALEQADAYFVQGKAVLELDRAVEAREIEGGPDAELTVKGKESLTLEDLTCGSLIIEDGVVTITGRLFVTGQITLKGGSLEVQGRFMADYLLLTGGKLEVPGGARLFAGMAQSGGEAVLGATQCDGNLTLSGGSLTVTDQNGTALTCEKELAITGGSLTVCSGEQAQDPEPTEPTDETGDYDQTTTLPVQVTGPGIQAQTLTMIGGELDAQGSPAIRAARHLAFYNPAVITLPQDAKIVKAAQSADAAAYYEIQGADGAAQTHVTAALDKTASRFTDVPDNSYYRIPVAWASTQKISNGTSKTTYSPSQPVTRAVVVNFLWKYAGSPEPKSLKTSFTDVKEDAYAYKAILWAVEKGIVKGVTDTQFQPDGRCSREQTILLIHRAAGSPKPQSTNSPFTDVKMKTLTTDAVLWAIETGVTVGTTPTTFSPDEACTRAMLTTFLYRLERLSWK